MERVVVEQADATMVDQLVVVTVVRSRSSTFDEVIAGRRTRDQIRAVVRVVPGLNDGSKSEVAGRDPVADAGRLVVNRTGVEHADIDGRCQSSSSYLN